MPDVVLLVKAAAIGAIFAAAVLWLAARLTPRLSLQDSFWGSARWSWAIGAGVIAASAATDQWPHWPALEDRTRFLTLLLPMTILVETLAAMLHSRGVAWSLRLGLAGVVAPILLHNTVYLVDLNGADSAEWSRTAAAIILCGLAVLLAVLWATFSALQRRTTTQAVHWLLALDALATAVTVMLSGYYRAGALGLGLAGAIVGATLASYIMPRQSTTGDSLGLSVIGVFSVALMGRFFGALSTNLMLSLIFAPLLVWTVELPRLRSLPNGWRTVARVACVFVPLLVVVIVAQRKFTKASAARSPAKQALLAPMDSANWEITALEMPAFLLTFRG